MEFSQTLSLFLNLFCLVGLLFLPYYLAKVFVGTRRAVARAPAHRDKIYLVYLYLGLVFALGFSGRLDERAKKKGGGYQICHGL